MLSDELSRIDIKALPITSRRNKKAGYQILILGLIPALLISFLIGLTFEGVIVRLISYPVSIIIFKLYYDFKRYLAADVITVLNKDNRPPVLYLRSFTDDRSVLPADSIRFKTYEQVLADAAQKSGPFVAIGDPREEMPELGAARMYTGDEWKDVVIKFMEASQIVIMQVGGSEGLLWEVQQVVSRISPDKFILCLPIDVNRTGYAQEQYNLFRKNTTGVFPKPLPEFIGDSRLLYFDDNWLPQPLPLCEASEFLNQLLQTTQPNSKTLIKCLSDLSHEIIRRVGFHPPSYYRKLLYRYAYTPILVVSLFICLLSGSWEMFIMGLGLTLFPLVTAIVTTRITRYINGWIIRKILNTKLPTQQPRVLSSPQR